jgi:predicted dehydrogenase
VLQVGSQFLSSVLNTKAKELLQSGAIGELNLVEAWVDRNSAIGATVYSIPPDASPSTIDWDRFVANAPKRPFDPVRFFRWRNYWDYGTGVAGDLYVHLLSTIHFVTGAIGPNSVSSTAGLHFWKDGRETPDVMLTLCHYAVGERHPAFHLMMRVNYKSGQAAETLGFRYVGSEGVMTVEEDLRISKPRPEPEPGYIIETFPKAVQEEYLKDYRQKYPAHAVSELLRPGEEETYTVRRGYNAHVDHHTAFYSAVRSRKPPVEDATFGFRAAAPALLANLSYLEGRTCRWDPRTMTLKG